MNAIRHAATIIMVGSLWESWAVCTGVYEAPGLSKLLVAGGASAAGAQEGTAEIINLNGSGDCPDIAPYPIPVWAAVGAFLGGKATVCGGRDSNLEFFSTCYSLAKGASTWELDEPLQEARAYAASTVMSNSSWWISGGGGETTISKSSTEVYTAGLGSQAYINGPVEKRSHHIVRVNNTHFVLLGTDASVFMFDKISETWSDLPELPQCNSNFASGLVQYPDGKELVFAVGGDVEGFSYGLNLNTLQWGAVPKPPFQISGATCVPYGRSFLMVGGKSGFPMLDTIVTFDAELEEWMLLPGYLQEPRTRVTAFFVPDDFITC